MNQPISKTYLEVAEFLLVTSFKGVLFSFSFFWRQATPSLSKILMGVTLMALPGIPSVHIVLLTFLMTFNGMGSVSFSWLASKKAGARVHFSRYL